MYTHENKILEAKQVFDGLKDYIFQAVSQGEAIHTVEMSVWVSVLEMGRLFLQGFVAEHGDGDKGETLTFPGGRTVKRLEELHERRYVSIFGEFPIVRRVYGTRETQKIEAVPLDASLQLPESDFSYVLQDWDQNFCVQNSFEESASSVQRILGIGQSVRTLEHMNQSMAGYVEGFRESQSVPVEREEGALLVVAVDGKGVPMRRKKGDAKPENPRHPKKGEKRNKKRMACVGAVYTIERFERTAEDVIDEALRKKAQEKRPRPKHKRVRADLSRAVDGQQCNGKDILFGWLAEEVQRRNRKGDKPVICLADGERALHEATRRTFDEIIEILDLYHALERLWDAAHCFYGEGSDEAEQFVEERLGKVLEGKVGYVIGGLRQMATKRGLRGIKKKKIRDITGYFQNNRSRMRYDEYLEAGFPIGTGVVEGACRNLVKDRMERAGMRWIVEGAQAMLDLRATYLNGEWDAFCNYRIEEETKRLYENIVPFEPIKLRLAG